MSGPDADARFREDNDSLYRMPMAIVPMETPELRRGRMIKNAALDAAIELYRSTEGVSGQMLIGELDNQTGHHMFGWPAQEQHPDLVTLRGLARLSSYDVYSLRIQFRELGIEPSSVEYLQLSPEKQESLRAYMQVFTRPLLTLVYGEGDRDALAATNIVDLFRDPDTEQARENLVRLARNLMVDVNEIPKFLDDFSDIYLSLAYYQEYVDDLTPKLIDMIDAIQGLTANWQLRQDPHFMTTLQRIEGEFNDLLASVSSRFEVFRQQSDRMWDNITAEKFRAIRDHVISSQKTVGGVLCGLGIKLNTWRERFPKSDVGGPIARAEMLFSEILPGLDKLNALEREGRSSKLAV
tara:strand:- start:10358 stop:11413 length:1056 start_codon:yes stop_codon:yes gene_type:complete